MAEYFTAPRIAWGPGAVEELSALAPRRALLVVDPKVVGTRGARRVEEELGKSDARVEVVPAGEDPRSASSIAALQERLEAFGPDWIVALGGGATLDAAKAARLFWEQPGVPREGPVPLDGFPSVPRSRLAAIPTTSGSGAEASWTADVYGPDGAPVELAHRGLVPDWALVDPSFAEGRGRAQVVAEGLEIAALAVEAYLSAWSNPFSDALAVDAVGTVLRRLPHAVRWSDDPEAPAALHYAATSAGLAASNAQRGVAHALARALERPTGLSYATLLGIVLPHVLEFDRPSARERLETLAQTVSRADEASHPPLVARLRRLYETLGFPSDLSAAKVARSRVEPARGTVVAHALRSPAVLANPRVPSSADVGHLLTAVLGGPS